MKAFSFILILSVLFISCEIAPKPIEYGSDNCEYCKMTIVDRQHASQIVTDKGRSYKFDAIECMIHYDREYLDQPAAMYLVSDFKMPGELIDATKASYLISPEISSPMGANLSGFNSEAAAEKTKEEYGGELYSWDSIKDHIKK
ncbi:nitrous oxide reductase accessory protein NosL [Salinimicrobium gaetbulicola]|uniref:Nitrous oxide reductase accessory protein NosL n=1 Tax=Salinimicrobium gaetbulicola TaxID=999702 RepID=A0ABW3IC35_9FLAO